MRALVDEGGVAAHLVSGPPLDDRLLDRAEGPGRLPGRRQPHVRGDLGERGVERRLERGLERLEVLAAGLLGAGVVDDPVGRPEVRRHLLPVPRVARHDHAGRRAQVALQRVEQRLVAGRHPREELLGRVGRGHERDPQVLGQAAQQAGHQLLAQAGHVPGEVVGLDPVQRRDRDVDRQAVLRGAGLEDVGDRERQPLRLPRLRVVRLAHLVGVLVGEHRRVEGQQVGLRPPRLLPPGVEVRAADHLGADPRVVEVEQRVLVDDEVAAPGAVLELLGLLEQPEVLAVELLVPGCAPLAVDQRVPDEHLAAQRLVDPAVLDEPVRDERDAVQGDPLVRHHGRALLGPVRLGVRPLDQVRADLLGPLRLDRGVLPRPEAAGLDELAGHQVRRVGALERAAGEDREPAVAGAQVLARAALPCGRAPPAGRCG